MLNSCTLRRRDSCTLAATPVITGPPELELIRRYQAGDRKAGELLLEAHAALIFTWAKRSFTKGVDPEDVLQEARLGFLHAVELFDPSFGAKLATYAINWIRQRAQRFVEDHGRTIQVPVHRQVQLRRLARGTEEEREGALAEDEQLRAAHFALRTASLDTPVGGEDDGSTLGALLDSGAPSPEELLLARDASSLSDEVNAAIAALSPREQEVLRRRFFGEEPEGLREIAADFGVVHERIRQIEAKALHRLRAKLTRTRAPVGAALLRKPVARNGSACSPTG